MNYAAAKVRMVGEPTPLTKEDMGRLFEGSWKPTVKADNLRHSHHRVARLMAAGLRDFEIIEKTGYSNARLAHLKGSPAFIELVARYAECVDRSFERSADEFLAVATRNMITAESMISDTLEEAQEDGVKLPLRDLLAISRDAADRFGYGKKSMVFNPGTDFAALLEKAVARSRTAPSRGDEVVEIDANV